jgi:hypothetical protein
LDIADHILFKSVDIKKVETIEKIICPVWWTNVSTDDRYSKIGINCVPLLAILLRHAYETYFFQGLLKNKNSAKL